VPVTKGPRKEYFVFSVDDSNWRQFDWSIITTVAVFSLDLEMMCFAHSHGARVVYLVDYPVANLSDADQRSAWISQQLDKVQSTFADGINIDVESPIAADSPEKDLLTVLVQEATAAFHNAIPQSQVTFDVAWSPNCIDGRCYSYADLALACDFLFVMAYDERSQVLDGPCIASANSALPNTVRGVKEYIAEGISEDKLVLGVPWYGYDYPCIHAENTTVCPIEHVPFRGANCSDAAGKQIPYSKIPQLLSTSTTGPQYSQELESPWFDYTLDGVQHQVWYDDPESLQWKYVWARNLRLRGIGMWNADELDYSDDPVARKHTREMWDAMHIF